MSRSRRPPSFKSRLLLALTGVGGMAAGAVCSLLITLHFLATRELAWEALATQARVIAVHSEAALSFGDQEAGGETLAALRADAGVVWAALYDAEGRLFAAFTRGDPRLPPTRWPMAPPAPPPDSGLLLLDEPVTHQGRPLGMVLAAYDPAAVHRRLRRDIVLSLLIGATVVAGAVVVAIQLRRRLTLPLSELLSTAQRVSATGDYSARARKHSQDEFGDLTDTFNEMLARIELQSDELHRRHREMQQFLYTVSHDLKSPLVTITGFVGILKEDLAQRQYDQVEESMAFLSQASRRMGRLIDDLLELSRIGRVPSQPEPLDVTALVNDVVGGLAPRAEQVGARIEVQPDLPNVIADRLRLTQVFDNLLNNALKYGVPEGGGPIEVGGERQGGEVRYHVRDHGPGVPPEHRERVFALFQRLHTSDEGTGVGLTVVSRIMEHCGGRVWLEPTPGGGATFWIALPEHPPPTSQVDGKDEADV